MTHRSPRLPRCLALALAVGCAVLRPGGAPAAQAGNVPLYVLITGGGPDVASNAAQIEGHVHFAASVLPEAARRTVLFADGKVDHATVSYADPSALADARRVLTLLLGDANASEPVLQRPPRLGVALDGPARLTDFRRALGRLSAQAAKEPAPLLLYFAGHGTQDEKNEGNTQYDLWNDEALKVRVLADELARLPRTVPVVLVMAQCFSGAFADVLFRHGDPKDGLALENLAGFFSARPDREAAGCSYAAERADYQDFSSYFFGALCGQDRFGEAVTGADFDGSGGVSLHEAFCYALIHDASADTPVCTSDVFLKRFAPVADAVIYGTPYKDVCQAATPAQRAVLEALSHDLDMVGETRALAVYDRLAYSDPRASATLVRAQADAKEKLGVLRQKTLADFFEKWPVLRWGDIQVKGYRQALEGLVDALMNDPELCRRLLDAQKARDLADGAVDSQEAALQRFAGLYEHIVAASTLARDGGKAQLKAQYARLWRAENAVLRLAAPRPAAGEAKSAGNDHPQPATPGTAGS